MGQDATALPQAELDAHVIAGTFWTLVDRTNAQSPDPRLIERCVAMHDRGEIDFLRSTESATFTELKPWQAFGLIGQVLPRLNASVTGMLDFQSRMLVSSGKHHEYELRAAFEKWCAAAGERSAEVIALAEQAVEPAIANLCLALVAPGQADEARRLNNFTTQRNTETLSFEIWDGDRLAGKLMEGYLKEELLPREMRSNLQKAVALLDEPTVAYHHFSLLADQLARAALASDAARVRAARQLSVATWMLFVWGRELGNLEGPYRISELAVLHAWEMVKPYINGQGRDAEAVSLALRGIVDLHLKVATAFIDERVAPVAQARDGLASRVGSRESVDVNLALFDTLGRVAMTSIWLRWIVQRSGEKADPAHAALADRYCDLAFALIGSNGALGLPIADEQNIDFTLTLIAWLSSERDAEPVQTWLTEMVARWGFTLSTRSRYPTASTDYRDWLTHPRNTEDEYFKETTRASILFPTLALWVAGFQRQDLMEELAAIRKDALAHTTMQLCLMDEDSEANLYLNKDDHGRTILDLPIKGDGADLIDLMLEACDRYADIGKLSAMQTDFWPIVLLSDAAYAAAAQKVYMGSIHGVIVESHPDLAQPPELLDRLYDDLTKEGLVGGSFKALMSASGVQNPQTTSFGKAFLDFIRAPEI